MSFQPSIKALWTNTRHTLWIASSRAVGVPSRAENDLILNNGIVGIDDSGLPSIVIIRGNTSVQSEELTALEFGYRSEITSTLFFDIAAFYNFYDSITTVEPEAPTLSFFSDMSPFIELPVVVHNRASAKSRGVELALQWQPKDWLAISGSYWFVEIDTDLDSNSADLSIEMNRGRSPEHNFILRSQFNLPGNIEFDAIYRYVDSTSTIASYHEVDARLAWRPRENIRLAVVGQNLLQPSHKEAFSDILFTAEGEVERGIYAKAIFEF